MNPSFGSSFRQAPSDSLDRTAKEKFKARARFEIAASGTPHKAVAYGANIDEGRFSKMLDDEYKESLAAYQVPAWTREVGPGLMEWLAIQCGGTYVHGVEGSKSTDAPSVLIGLLAVNSGNTIQQLVQDLADNHWSEEERKAAVPTLRKLKSIVRMLLHQAEGVEP